MVRPFPQLMGYEHGRGEGAVGGTGIDPARDRPGDRTGSPDGTAGVAAG